MTAILRAPHKLYKQYQPFIESLFAAGGLGALVALVLVNLPVYPQNWAPVLVTLIVLVGLRWPLAAYALAGIALLYPIYSISLYLALLFAAVVIVGHRPFSHYLGATVLVLAVPLLAQYNLHWLVPILAGLWWGTANGFWIGGAAALWGKLFFGMAGLNIDWLNMVGQSPTLAAVMQRFNGLNSLETGLKLLHPFAPDATALLYNVLQIALWAAVGGLVGSLAAQKWIHHNHFGATLVISGAGAISLALGEIILANWLVETAPASLNYTQMAMGAVGSFAIAAFLETFRNALDLPIAPKIKKRRFTAPLFAKHTTSPPAHQPTQSKPMPVHLPDLPEWEPPKENSDLILLELD